MATDKPSENPPETNNAPNGAQEEEAADETAPVLPEPKLPTHKDTSLKELLGKMDDYAPIVRYPSQDSVLPRKNLHLYKWVTLGKRGSN